MNRQHREAFALMLYRNEQSGREEWIWNSRDGVTPFGIADPEGGEMRHVDWFRDAHAPFYVPPIGSRIFVTLTEARARVHALSIYERWSHDPAFLENLASRGETREAFLEAKARELIEYGGGGSPDIVVVDTDLWLAFRAREPMRGPSVVIPPGVQERRRVETLTKQIEYLANRKGRSS